MRVMARRLRLLRLLVALVALYLAFAVPATQAAPNTARPAAVAPAVAPTTAAVDQPPCPPKVDSTKRELVVGTHPIPPFVIKNADGTWSGISIDIWKRVAEEMHLTYAIRELPVNELLRPDDSGIDVVVSVNASSKNEEAMDVSHGFYATGLGIATSTEPKSSTRTIVQKVFTWKVARGLGVILLVLLVMGTVVWLVERKKKPEEFGGSVGRGIAAGMFWTFESLVGKGAALSRSVLNRIIALLWTAVCVLGISGVTASLSSELTVNKLSTSVNGPNDLPRVRVGTVRKPSSGATYLENRSIPFTGYEDLPKAVDALAKGEIDAVVFEAPILQYETNKLPPGKVVVLPGTFANHAYGFGLRSGSDLRENLDRTILKLAERDEFRKIFGRYLGTSAD